jgi:two-component system sensor histidine kinase PhcS
MPTIPPEFCAAYAEHDRELTIRKTRLGCFIGIILVPMFTALDHYMYPAQAQSFLLARLICSVLMACLYPVIGTEFGRKHYRFQGLVILFLPSAIIAWMIYATEGAASPYYAGLILVMMVLAVVLDWTFWQSVASVVMVWLLYLTACWFSPAAAGPGILVNNTFFLVSTGITIIIGSQFHTTIRQREFASRCELDRSKQEVEASNLKLADQNMELAKANRDIKEKEAQLVQADRLSSLGILSAGINHEIKNDLNPAILKVFTLKNIGQTLPPEIAGELMPRLETIDRNLSQISNFVAELETFSSPSGEAGELVEPAAVAHFVVRLLSDRFKKDHLQVHENIPADQKCWMNRHMLMHVLLNLLKNSADALEGKKFPAGEVPQIWLEGRYENHRSLVTIRDNGTGIASHHLAKVFTPFRTTKEVGKGTGLGLSISYRIMQRYGGGIIVKSEAGKFCEFTLDFPAEARCETTT